MVEALLFAASEPLDLKALSTSLPEGADVPGLLKSLQEIYEKRGVNLCCVAGKYQFRTAADLAFLLRKEQPEQKRLSKAAIETLAIIAYHQPVTRAEIEDIRGVAMSKGTIDMLMEIGWIKIRGRKRTPGRPVTYGTAEAFLVQFGLESVAHQPGLDELKAAGFLEAIPPSGFDVPSPSDELGPDEDPYTGEEPEDLATGSPNLDEASTAPSVSWPANAGHPVGRGCRMESVSLCRNRNGPDGLMSCVVRAHEHDNQYCDETHGREGDSYPSRSLLGGIFEQANSSNSDSHYFE
jgi:segregation and condensation protein B